MNYLRASIIIFSWSILTTAPTQGKTINSPKNLGLSIELKANCTLQLYNDQDELVYCERASKGQFMINHLALKPGVYRFEYNTRGQKNKGYFIIY